MEFHPASIAEAMESARSEGDISELRAVRAWLNERAKDAFNSLFLDRQKGGILSKEDRQKLREDFRRFEMLSEVALAHEMALENGRGHG